MQRMPKLTHEIRILIKCGAQDNEKRLHKAGPAVA